MNKTNCRREVISLVLILLLSGCSSYPKQKWNYNKLLVYTKPDSMFVNYYFYDLNNDHQYLFKSVSLNKENGFIKSYDSYNSIVYKESTNIVVYNYKTGKNNIIKHLDERFQLLSEEYLLMADSSEKLLYLFSLKDTFTNKCDTIDSDELENAYFSGSSMSENNGKIYFKCMWTNYQLYDIRTKTFNRDNEWSEYPPMWRNIIIGDTLYAIYEKGNDISFLLYDLSIRKEIKKISLNKSFVFASGAISWFEQDKKKYFIVRQEDGMFSAGISNYCIICSNDGTIYKLPSLDKFYSDVRFSGFIDMNCLKIIQPRLIQNAP